MSNFNQVTLMGNLTRNPQLSYTPNKTAVVEFGLGVNRKWKKEDGSLGEEVLFVDCKDYGKRAEVINKHFEKGSPIFVQGRLKLDQWHKDGKTHSRIRVLVEKFEFLISSRPDESSKAADNR